MPKQEIPDKLKRERPDPKAFDRFKNLSKAIVQVPKDEADKEDSRSTKTPSTDA
ncbi:MAG: hypothetical protein QF463_00095 [Vicinamibacterales bacterium]|jgi:hypothetical protein|nr:hypothetical protein [Vicinamibacterales bacterium]MDP6607452.1 hypothetical protein [Vicinamibacterales bacterium]|tara:strand:- start:6109 stop:6270 length:162 start_codon:yes stop_codon:yes gene_type:complete